MSKRDVPTYTWEEIKKHNSDTDCWVVLYDSVLDVTEFLNEHPGGLDPLVDQAGCDITNSFESIGHTSTALAKSKSFIVGRVDSASKKTGPTTAAPPPPSWSENKENLKRYKAGGEIIPLWVIISAVLAFLLLVFYFAF